MKLSTLNKTIPISRTTITKITIIIINTMTTTVKILKEEKSIKAPLMLSTGS